MRLRNRRPGTSVAFVDAATDEVILEVTSDKEGRPSVYFRLYDSTGCLAAESAEAKSQPASVTIHSRDGELLLDVPVDPASPFLYRLYNSRGVLLTSSDGIRTKIRPLLRMVAGRC
jgi:hypothetical protein